METTKGKFSELLINELKIIQPEEQKEKSITEPQGPLGHYL